MLIVTVYPEVLLKDLIHPLGLAITFRMMSGGKVQSDVEGLTKGAEEMRDELRASVGGNVGGNSMLREYMKEEKLCELWECNCVVSRYEDALFGQTINDNEY